MKNMLSLPDYPVRQRDFLLEIARAITEQLDLSVVLRRVLYASVAMVAGQVGLVALRNENDQLFYVRAYMGMNADNVAPLNNKLKELVENADEGFDYEFLNEKLKEMATLIDPNLKHSFAMPLIFAGTPLGLLVVFRSYQARVTSNDVQILQSFADQAAIAVHNAQLYERINQERQRLAAILEHSGDGVMILNADLSILQVNQALEGMTSWRSQDAVGRHHDDVIEWLRIDQPDIKAMLDDGWPHQLPPATETHYVEGDIQRRDGLSMSIGITYAPLFNADNRLMTIIANVRDVTNFRRAQEMQNVFISTVSHELRTPVAIIKGYASTLNRDDARWDENVIRQSLEVIEEEADRLKELIDDLLTASRIQAEQTIKLQLASIQLDELVMRSVERFRNQSESHRFVVSFPDDFPPVQGDAKRLRQVVDNLITNAIKYSPEGGTITVGGRFNNESATVFVRDEGIGIAEKDLIHVFDRFYRVENTLTSKTKGTGLGLYLAKAIIEAHNGTIHVKSHYGKGSTFYFTLPRE